MENVFAQYKGIRLEFRDLGAKSTVFHSPERGQITPFIFDPPF